MKASESAREAAMRLLDQQAIRFHKDGTFRDWDNTVQAFTQAEARGRLAGIREALDVMEMCCEPCPGCNEGVNALLAKDILVKGKMF